ncbi:MAG: nuclear transport factor 2 family protein [Sciscionella sp.]
MADRAKIADLWAGYGAANDLHDGELMESCFTEDASFTIHIAGADSVGPLQPREKVLEFITGAVSAQTDQRRHVLTNFRYFDDEEPRARVGAYLSLVVTDNGQTVTKSAGVYDAEVVLTDGQWRFRSMVLSLDSPF